jgi:glycosyltransferase involved in cell wall biosynthesis
MFKYMILSIIIPVFNERKTLKEILRRVNDAPLPDDMKKEIIIIDDGSTDGTVNILKDLETLPENNYRIFYQEKNIGKGAAITKGLLKSTGDIALIQDADFEYDPNEYSMLLQPILNKEADVVYGSRLMSSKPHRVLLYWHYLANRIMTTFSNMLTNLNLTDMETCYKVFSRKVIDKIAPELKSNRFGIEPEITARVARERFKIYEVGISYHGRDYTEGKKLNWKDGVAAIWHILRFNLFK